MFELDRYEYFEDVNLGLVRHVPTGLRVLDVGCGSGLLGAEYRRRANVVWGIDSAEEVREVAANRLDRFVLADVTDEAAVTAALGDERFDLIVFADVLEHLYDPVGTLRWYRRFLRAGGRVHVSVPNIGLWSARVALLAGRFDYAQTGTLDKTHIRFFTRRTVRKLFAAAGLELEELDLTPGLARPFVPLVKRAMARDGEVERRAIIDSRPYKAYARLIYPAERQLCRLAPGLLAFQHIAIGRDGRA